LQDADVKTISAKKIRNQLEENYGEDLTDWWVNIVPDVLQFI
jgi:hypothetical protein